MLILVEIRRCLSLCQFIPKNEGIVMIVIEPIFLNVYGAQESIQRKEFRQPM